eukprot:EG_transcript_28910
MKLWEPPSEDPKAKKPRVQKVLSFGATNIQVPCLFLGALPLVAGYSKTFFLKNGPSLASTANLERNLSTMGHVYGQRQTNLGIEKAGKLTFLFRALNPSD